MRQGKERKGNEEREKGKGKDSGGDGIDEGIGIKKKGKE